MSKTTIPTGGITADAINGTLIADDAINSEHYTDGSIDTAHIGDDQVTAAKATGVGGLAFIQAQTVTSDTTTVNFNTVFSSTYDNYLFIFDATLKNAAQLEMRYRTGSPSDANYTASNTYRYSFSGQSSANNDVSQNSNANVKWTMGDTVYAATNIGAPAVHGVIYFNTPFTSGKQRTWTSTFVTYDDADQQRAFSGGGRIVNSQQMTGFGFSCSSGDFTEFTGRVYGVVDS
jgi:hypothetical protein